MARGSAPSGDAAVDGSALVRAVAHPLRRRVLGVLQEHVASPSELSAELEAPLGNVCYHVRALQDLGLIELVRKTARGGAIEHHYAASSAAQVAGVGWSSNPRLAREATATAALDDVARIVSSAAADGGFDRAGARFGRTRLELDEQGWTDLAAEFARLERRAQEIESESAERRVSGGEKASPISAGLIALLFERGTVPTPDEIAPVVLPEHSD